MRRYTFGAFIPDDANRAALQLCQDVAGLRPVAPLPLILVGDEGSGKTHLLYSIVNRIKASTDKTGIAYITANDFPLRVQSLVDDPTPVERAESAVLLVDQLEEFEDLLEELEAVIRLFLSNGHYVAIASRVHPGRLIHLPESLAEVLETGQVSRVTGDSASGSTDVLSDRIDREREDVIERQRAEIASLKAKLGAAALSPEGAEPGDLERIRTERDALKRELDTVKANAALKSASTREVAVLRERLEEMETKYENASRELESIRHDRADEEIIRVRARLTEAEAEGARARAEANDLLERAEALVSRIQHPPEGGVEDDELSDITHSLDAINKEAIGSAMTRAQEAIAQLEERHSELESLKESRDELLENVNRTKDQVSIALRERDKAMEELKAATDERDSLLERINNQSFGNESLFSKLSEANAECERLRQQAAEGERLRTAETKKFLERIRALEKARDAAESDRSTALDRLSAVAGAYEHARESNRIIETELKNLSEHFAEAASLLTTLSAKFAGEFIEHTAPTKDARPPIELRDVADSAPILLSETADDAEENEESEQEDEPGEPNPPFSTSSIPFRAIRTPAEIRMERELRDNEAGASRPTLRHVEQLQDENDTFYDDLDVMHLPDLTQGRLRSDEAQSSG